MLTNDWDEFTHGGSKKMDDIQKTIENAYDAVREEEEPTCCVCHAPIGLFCYSKQSRIPHGLKLDVMHEFGCQKCGRLGHGGTPYLAIVDYVRKYEETVVL